MNVKDKKMTHLDKELCFDWQESDVTSKCTRSINQFGVFSMNSKKIRKFIMSE